MPKVGVEPTSQVFQTSAVTTLATSACLAFRRPWSAFIISTFFSFLIQKFPSQFLLSLIEELGTEYHNIPLHKHFMPLSPQILPTYVSTFPDFFSAHFPDEPIYPPSVPLRGVEPPHLSAYASETYVYTNFTTAAGNLERVEGIGPSPKDWKSLVLPLNYTRNVQITL